MALTLGTPSRNTVGARQQVRIAVTFDSSYATGGETFSAAAAAGLTVVEEVRVDPSGGYVGQYIPSTGKILVRWVDTTVDGAALAEVASTTNLSAVTFNVVVTGY